VSPVPGHPAPSRPQPQAAGQIPLARPLLGEAEEARVVEVLRSGRLSLGPQVAEFETAMARRLGVQHACAVSSGTAGLHLAVRAVGVREGDEVITSPLSFVASANVILYERATPVFVDVDPVTFNLDPAAAEAAVSERTSALLPVHLFGYPADVPALERLGLPIVEDACEALGAVHADGVAVGGRGHPSVFGFYANKQLTTGEGGLVALSDPEQRRRIESERNQGRPADMSWLEHERLGFNYRLSDVACAIGLAQLERLDSMLAERRRVAAAYRAALRGVEGLGLPCEDRGGNRRSWFVYVVQLPAHVERGTVIEGLARHGIQSKAYLPAIHLMGFYRQRFGYREGRFPVCEEIAARSLALPFYPQMSDGDVERVSSALADVLAVR
jgi:dTDP-4-amino-4,6-dideoxygalactose transaminase